MQVSSMILCWADASLRHCSGRSFLSSISKSSKSYSSLSAQVCFSDPDKEQRAYRQRFFFAQILLKMGKYFKTMENSKSVCLTFVRFAHQSWKNKTMKSKTMNSKNGHCNPINCNRHRSIGVHHNFLEWRSEGCFRFWVATQSR